MSLRRGLQISSACQKHTNCELRIKSKLKTTLQCNVFTIILKPRKKKKKKKKRKEKKRKEKKRKPEPFPSGTVRLYNISVNYFVSNSHKSWASFYRLNQHKQRMVS
jgi:hypothetical protein